MATTAVDGLSLQSEQAAGRALSWGSDSQGWITAHNLELGFTGNPDEPFQTVNGIRSITQIGTELKGVGYIGPWDRGSLISAYTNATRGQVLPYSPAPANPAGSNNGRGGTGSDTTRQGITPTQTGTGTTPTVAGISISGDPWQWLRQNHTVLGTLQVPGYLLATGAVFGLMLLSGGGRRR